MRSSCRAGWTIWDTETAEFPHWRAFYRQDRLDLKPSDWLQGIGTWGAFDPWAALPEEVRAPLSTDSATNWLSMLMLLVGHGRSSISRARLYGRTPGAGPAAAPATAGDGQSGVNWVLIVSCHDTRTAQPPFGGPHE